MAALRGKCIDTMGSLNLDTETTYYLFEHTPESYYVSRFNRPGAHFGAYQKSRFTIVGKEEIEVKENQEKDESPVFSLFNEEVVVKENPERKSNNKSEELQNQMSLFDFID